MHSKPRLFLILWTLGLLGVLSFLLVDLHTLISLIPQPAGAEPVELPPAALLKLATFFQTAVIMSLAVLVGIGLAGRVALHAPAAEATASGGEVLAVLRPQIVPGIVVGLAGGVAIAGTWVIGKPFFSAEFIDRAQQFNQVLPHITRFLYGGLTEEILLRWGLMTFLVWVGWRLFQRGSARPGAGVYVAAIFISAIVFGIGHLPLASLLAGGLTLPIVVYVITANSIFGIAAGFLYWRKGLEAAMIAHIFVHVVLIAALYMAI